MAYFSLIINILKVLQVSELTQNIVELVMGIIALVLIGWSELSDGTLWEVHTAL